MIDNFSLKELTALTDNNKKLESELLALFKEELDELLMEISDNEIDFNSIQSKIHKAKTKFSLLGMHYTRELADKLEYKVDQKTLHKFIQLVREIKKKIESYD